MATVHEHDAKDLAMDARTGSVAPRAAQRDAVRGMDARAQWNRFGTPSSLIREGGWLAVGLDGSPSEVAVRSCAATPPCSAFPRLTLEPTKSSTTPD